MEREQINKTSTNKRIKYYIKTTQFNNIIELEQPKHHE